MPTLRVATREELAALVDALQATTWPMQTSALLHLANNLGWRTLGARRKGFSFQTGLGFNFDFVNALAPQGSITQLTIGVTDSTRGLGQDARALAAAFTHISGHVSAILGHDGVLARRGRRWWDLNTNARIAVEQLDDQVILELLAPQYADIERRERNAET